MPELRIVINGESVSAEAALKRVQAELKGTGQAGQTSAAQTAAAFRTLPAQFTDIATQLQGGANPLTVLLQQGGQIKDSFGGIGPAVRALTTVFTPLRLAVGGAAAAVVAVGLAAYEGAQQSKEFAKALALTGNTAGITEGQFNALVRTTAQAGGAAVGDVREMMQAIVAAGGTAAQSMTETGRAAIALSRLNGQSLVDNAKMLASVGDNITAFALKANKAYGVLTEAQVKQVMAMQAQGRDAEAVRLVMDQLAQTIEGRMTTSLGGIERMWKTATAAASGFWDALKGIGAEETAEQRIARLQATIDNFTPKADADWLDRIWNWGGVGYDDTAQRRAAAQRDLETAQRTAAREALRAMDRANAVVAEQERVAALARANDMLAIDAARNQAQTQMQADGLAERRALTEQAYRQWEIGAGQFRDRMIAIERERLAGEVAAAREALRIASARSTWTPEQEAARKAAEWAAKAKLSGAQSALSLLPTRIAGGDFDAKPRTFVQGSAADFRSSEIAADNAANQPALRANAASMDAAQSLLQTNRTLSAELITDARQRAVALLDIEVDAARSKLDLLNGTDEERKQKQTAFDQWMVLRQSKLEEDLKPAWQKSLESWGDTNRLMRESWDSLMGNVLKAGEDAFVEFARTGKLNIRGLVDTIIAEMARAQFRKLIGGIGGDGSFGGLLGAIGKLFGAIGFGTGAGYGNQDYGQYFHAGGVVGIDRAARVAQVNAADWISAPRLHQGLASDEYRAILQRGESVLTPGQMAKLGPAGGGPVTVVLAPTMHIDARSDQAQVAQLVITAMTQAKRDMWAELRARRLA